MGTIRRLTECAIGAMRVTVVRGFVSERLQVAGERDCCDGGGLSAIDLCDMRLQRNSSWKWSERHSYQCILPCAFSHLTQLAVVLVHPILELVHMLVSV